MPGYFLDSSALVKRYIVESGTAVVNHVFQRVSRSDLICLSISGPEVVSVFVRKMNAQAISASELARAVLIASAWV